MNSSTSKQKKHAGFTLIEIMVVVLIIGMLVSVVGPSIWGALFSSQTKIAGTQIHQFHDALAQYRMNQFSVPDSLEALTEPDPVTGEAYMKRIPLDPWNHEYQYELDSDKNPIITCYGADGAPGGEGMDQDITSETLGI